MRRYTTSFVMVSVIVTLAAILPNKVSAFDYSVQEVNLTNYVGNNQNIHPKVLYFKDGWNGYKFWMAYTPYPFGIPTHENPSIAASDDGINWSLPNGCPNPLDTPPSFGYNSDTHLVYRPDSNSLECWYRAYDDPTTMDCLMMRSTKDGVNWSQPVAVAPWTGTFRLSPAVYCEDNRYVMYYVNGLEVYITRSGNNYDHTQWSNPVKVNLGDSSAKVWHIDVVPGNDGWNELLFQDCGIHGNSNNFSSLCYLKYHEATDTATEIKKILVPDGDDKSAMGQGIYRSSLVNVGDEQYIYASSLAIDQTRHMTVFQGKDLIQKMAEYVVADVSEIPSEAVEIKISGRTIYTDNNLNLEVYDISGHNVGCAPKVSVDNPGLYIVSVGSKTEKIIIR
ncbi:MAG: hypothetical protein HDS31_08575 [Bacteroides sp.]|nr:hypothetical protein [Bacteroides sp.]